MIYKSHLKEGGYTSFTNHIGEKDSFYDPNKREPDLTEIDNAIRNDDSANPAGYWLRHFEKGVDYSTKEGLELAAYRWYGNYWSDLVHDLRREGGYSESKRCEADLKVLHDKILQKALDMGLTTDDVDKDGALIEILQNAEKRAKRVSAMKANQPSRLAKYQKKALETSNETLRKLLNDDGTLKDRKSWGIIKYFLDTDDGKIFKNLWVNQFK